MEVFLSKIRRGISNMDDFYKPYLTTNETRYNELVMVADYRMVSQRNKLYRIQVGVLSVAKWSHAINRSFRKVKKENETLLDCKRKNGLCVERNIYESMPSS